MAQYRKKPIVIEAIQFTGNNCITCLLFIYGDNYQIADEIHSTDNPIIHTLECDMTASIGDYIIKGVKGEFYPCKPDIFEASYDIV